MVKYVPTYTMGKLKKKDRQKSHQMMLMQCFCVIVFFPIFLIKAYAVGIHLNCIDKSMQFKQVPTTYVFIKK